MGKWLIIFALQQYVCLSKPFRYHLYLIFFLFGKCKSSEFYEKWLFFIVQHELIYKLLTVWLEFCLVGKMTITSRLNNRKQLKGSKS